MEVRLRGVLREDKAACAEADSLADCKRSQPTLFDAEPALVQHEWG